MCSITTLTRCRGACLLNKGGSGTPGASPVQKRGQTTPADLWARLVQAVRPGTICETVASGALLGAPISRISFFAHLKSHFSSVGERRGGEL
jgi:hypothetical protein